MNEQEFENLLALAKSNNIDSVKLARTILESSDPTEQQKDMILFHCALSDWKKESNINFLFHEFNFNSHE